jgi:hypothetical protein
VKWPLVIPNASFVFPKAPCKGYILGYTLQMDVHKLKLVGNLSNTSTTSPISQVHNSYKPLNLEHTFIYHVGLCDWNHPTKTLSHKLHIKEIVTKKIILLPHKSHRTKTHDTRGNATHRGFRKGLEFPLMFFGIVKL